MSYHAFKYIVRIGIYCKCGALSFFNSAYVSFIHIGQPTPIMQAKFGTAPRIQLNDSYRTEKDILDFIAAERDKLNESDRALMTVCLKADDATKMGIITDVKQELRRANALKLSYAASKSMGY